jgi:hypothetical protein
MARDRTGQGWSRTTWSSKNIPSFRGRPIPPIENIWADLEKRLEQNQEEIPKARLWEVVDDEWEKTSKKLCKKLFASMPKRLAAVIKAKGGYTHY